MHEILCSRLRLATGFDLPSGSATFRTMIYLYIAAGGAFGAVCRYALSSAITGAFGKEFPYATMSVNILGSLLMGVVIGVIMTMLPKGKEFHALMVIGALGGFTTFSAFSYDAYMLLERSDWVGAGIYIIGSVALSILAFIAGMWLFKVFA